MRPIRSRDINSSLTIVCAIIVLVSHLCAGSDNALQKAIDAPDHLAIDSAGNLYISEHGKRILRLDPGSNTVTVFAGNGRECCRKENVPARKSSIYDVYSLALDKDNNLYIGGRSAKDGAVVRVVHSHNGEIE